MTPYVSRRQSLAQLALAATLPIAGAALMATPAYADDSYPTKAVKIVVPFPPGGSTDQIARRLAEKLAVAWGKPVIVDNRAGAGGTVGADYVAKSAPDGYTLLLGVTGSNAIAQSLYTKLPYNVVKDFAPVTVVVSAPLVLAVNPQFKASNLTEFVQRAKERPGHVSFGSAGNGTSMHLTGEMFKQASKTAMVHIPYRGNGPKLNDLMAGMIDATFGDLLVLQPQIEAGKIRALAVTSKRRNPMLPNVPTIAESGYPGFEALSWQGLFAPAGTPDAVIHKINADVAKALKASDIQDYFSARGFIMDSSTPPEFKRFIKAETSKWAAIVKASGAKAD